MPPTIEPDTTLGPSTASEEIVADEVEQMVSHSNQTVSEATATNSSSETINSTNVEMSALNGATENNTTNEEENSTNIHNSTTTETTYMTEQSSTPMADNSTTGFVKTAATESDTTTWAEIEQKCGEKTGKIHPWIVVLEHTDPKGQSNKKTVSKGVLIDKRHILTTVSSVHNSRPFWTVYG